MLTQSFMTTTKGLVPPLVEQARHCFQRKFRLALNLATLVLILELQQDSKAAAPPQPTLNLVDTLNSRQASLAALAAPGGTSAIDYFTPEGPVGTTVLINLNVGGEVKSVRIGNLDAAFTIYEVPLRPALVATVPKGATTGLITVATDEATYVSTQPFKVTSKLPVNWPRISLIQPFEGAVGTQVFIAGLNLNYGPVNVNFGQVPAAAIRVGSGLVVTVPAEAVTAPIAVTTFIGSVSSVTPFRVTTATQKPFPPLIVDFSPSQVDHSTGSQFAIEGVNLTDATSVRLNGQEVESFTVLGDTLILATLPEGSTEGLVSVTTPNGKGTSNKMLEFGASLPVISSFSPLMGSPGNSVSIFFSEVTEVSSVRFSGELDAQATFQGFPAGVTGRGIVAIVPAEAVNGPITITTTRGELITRESFAVNRGAWALTPRITEIYPESAPRGASVLIRGSALVGVIAGVDFDGTRADFLPAPGGVQAIVPLSLATGSVGTVSITTLLGKATATNSFFVSSESSPNQAPLIEKISPQAGLVGTAVEIKGRNLVDVQSVKINGIEAQFTQELAPYVIIATVPEGATSGLITVVTPNGLATSPGQLQIGDVHISSITPITGSVLSELTILGTSLDQATKVRIDSVATAFTVVSPNKIVAIIPTNAVTGIVRVATPLGEIGGNLPVYTVVPRIDSFTPISGYEGTEVHIFGSGFTEPDALLFGEISEDFTRISANEIKAKVPANFGAGPIIIAFGEQAAFSSTPFTPAELKVVSMSPTTGHVGDEITLTGTGMQSATAVVFGKRHAPAKVISEQKITATVPPEATSGEIGVVSPNATFFGDGLVFGVLPKIIAIEPSAGTVGSNIHLRGTGFADAIRVEFNGTLAEYSIEAPDLIIATVPFGAITGPIQVSTSGGQAKFPKDFEVAPSADLVLSMSTSRTVAWVGDAIVYSLVVTNGSRLTAASLRVDHFITDAAKINSTTLSQGTWSIDGNLLSCQLGDLLAGGTVSIKVSTTLIKGESVISAAIVSSETPDEIIENNFVTSFVEAVQPPQLSARHLPDGHVEISWSSSAKGFFLQMKEGADWPGTWAFLTKKSSLLRGRFVVNLLPADQVQLFRLVIED
ncbi:MAG: hypothetical protein EXS31_01385 [Pedosphaera sp.]|nr:hypothetical protein [Pedosphaera sp.]